MYYGLFKEKTCLQVINTASPPPNFRLLTEGEVLAVLGRNMPIYENTDQPETFYNETIRNIINSI